MSGVVLRLPQTIDGRLVKLTRIESMILGALQAEPLLPSQLIEKLGENEEMVVNAYQKMVDYGQLEVDKRWRLRIPEHE